MILQCRRCPKKIGEDEVAHLIPVRTNGYKPTLEMDRCVIVCTDCLSAHDKGFQERPFSYSAPPKKELSLTEPQCRLLEQVALGRVYRRPRRILFADPLTGKDILCTEKGYQLLKLNLVKWEIVPADEQKPGGPNAWMRLTETGASFLKRGTEVSA